MTTSSRNFSTLDIARSRSTSGAATDISERVLMKLEENGSLSEIDLTSAIGADQEVLRGYVEMLVNLKLVEFRRR